MNYRVQGLLKILHEPWNPLGSATNPVSVADPEFSWDGANFQS